MPLQGKKIFQRLKPPSDLRLNEELFYCKITHEVFREYEKFFDRVILCNSLVWSCSLTGRGGLTFQESLDSEKNARLTLQRFPEPLKKPLLYLATLTSRSRLNDMCDDVFTFARDHYFVGETVDVVFNGVKKSAVVTKVISNETKSPNKERGTPKPKNISPDKIKYEVKEPGSPKTLQAKGSQISRTKGTYTKANNKLLLKHNSVCSDGIWIVQDEVVDSSLQDFDFKEVSSGALPKYAAVSPTKKKVTPLSTDKKKKAITPISNGKKNTTQGKLTFKKDSAEDRAKALEKEQEEFEQSRMLLEEQRQKKRDQMRKQMEEEKERQRAIKLKEKEQKKEEQRKMAEYLNTWKQPRDDLECDDLKDLPKPTSVECSIPQDCFGDAVMILEFVKTFSTLLKARNFFPHGLTMEHFEKALVETDIQGFFNDILQLLLTALFESEELEYERVRDTVHVNPPVCDLKADMSLKDAQKIADESFKWANYYQGSTLSTIPMDSFSLTEILRLHILRSGARKNQAFATGYNGLSEDPGLQFKVDEHSLVEKLAATSVFQLNCEERLKILNLLVSQLVCCDAVCNHIEKNFSETLMEHKSKLKKLRLEFYRQQKEEALNKINKEPDDKTAAVTPTTEAEEPKENGKETIPDFFKNGNTKKLMSKEEFTRKESEIKFQIDTLKSTYQGMFLGQDRAFRRYWLFSSVSGIFVEDDECHVGPCLPKVTVQVPPNATAISRADGSMGSIRKFLQHLDDNKNGSSDKENDILQDLAIIQSDFSIPLKGRKLSDLNTRDLKKPIVDNATQGVDCLQCKEKADLQGVTPWFCPHSKQSSVFGLCTAFIDTCPVHNLNAPRTKWSFFYKQEDLETLLFSLNPRGFREGLLKKNLVTWKEVVIKSMTQCPYNNLNLTLPPPLQPEVRKSQRGSHSTTRKSAFADLTPEVAFEVTLREMVAELESRIFAGGLGSMKNIGNREDWRNKIMLPVADSTLETKSLSDNSESSHLSTVKDMSEALKQISEGIESKYLKPPLGPSKQPETPSLQMPLQRWQISLMSCTSLSQLFLHLGTLERSVHWARSALKAHCRICRRRCDPDKMLLCDECNRGHHFYCLKPPLKGIPKGDWFCQVCRPPEKVVTPRKKRVDYKETEDDEMSEDDNSEEASEEESDGVAELDSDSGEDDSEEAQEVIVDEVCESCGGTGTVICCDKCPKVYHPECIGLKRIPRGEWLCPHCSKAATKKHRPSGSYGTRAQSILNKAKKNFKKRDSSRPKIQIKAAPSRKRKISTDSESDEAPPKPKKVRIENKKTAVNKEAVKEKKDAEKEKKVVEKEKKVVEKVKKDSEKVKKDSDKEKKDAENNPFKKVYKDSTGSISRRRSKSLGTADMLDYPTCVDFLEDLIRHPSGWPFLVPVSKRDAPDYHQIIKRPMDFGTIRSNLNNVKYKTNDEFLRDIYLVLQNCEIFNPRQTPEYKAAQVLHKEVVQLLQKHTLSHTVRRGDVDNSD